MALYFTLYRVGDLVIYHDGNGTLKEARVIRVFYELRPNRGHTTYLLDNDTLVDEDGTIANERRRMLDEIGARIAEMGNGHE